MPMVGYAPSTIGESLLGVVALVVVGAVAVNGTKPDGTPFSIFSSGVAGFLEKMGVPVTVATVFMTMCVSALALTSLDSVARIGRMSFQELFLGDTTDTAKMTPVQRVLTNKYFATVITLFFGYLLTLGGYNNVLPLFGSANQLLAGLVIYRTGSILKNHRSYRLDAVFPYGNDVSRNLHRIDPEDDRTGEKCGCRTGNLPGGRFTADRCHTAYGTGCYGCLQLHPQAVRCREKFRKRGSVIQQRNSR